MSLQQRLQEEAQSRAAELTARTVPTRCISCDKPSPQLIPVEFQWRKQVGRGAEHHVRVEHRSTHPLCHECLNGLKTRRRRFWPLRYAGGILLAAGICGVVTIPALLLFMQLNREETKQLVAVGIVSAPILFIGLCFLNRARHHSVPATLIDMTGRGWECVSIHEIPTNQPAGVMR